MTREVCAVALIVPFFIGSAVAAPPISDIATSTQPVKIPASGGKEVDMQIISELRLDTPTTESIQMELPAIAPGEQVRFGLDARIDWPNLAGSNPWMQVQINDQKLVLSDLVNKEQEFVMRDGSDTTWAYAANWRLLYSPDFSDDVKTKKFPYGIADSEPYRFVWNITPYIKPGKNTISITQLKVLSQPTTMVVRDARIQVGVPINASGTGAMPAPTGALPTYVARGAQKVAMRVRLGQNGKLQFKVGDSHFETETRTSQPDGKWIGTQEGDARSREVLAGKSASAQWSGTGYRVNRKVTVFDDRIRIADTFSNISNDVVGVLYENRLRLAARPAEILLAGRPVFAEQQSMEMPEHPTAFARWKNISVGLTADDDIFRVHHLAFCEPGAVGLTDNKLGIAPGQSHTLEWSIYPLPKGDYWDFINAVRRNWNSNFTLPFVSFDFPGLAKGNISAEEHCRRVKSRGAQWLMSDQTYYEPDEIKPEELVRPEYVEQFTNRKTGTAVAEGTGIPHARQWIQRARDWSEKVDQCDPALKTLIYLHTQILTEPNHYQLYDELITDARGETVNATYYFPLPLYLPTLDNDYGKALLTAVPEILRLTKADGFYNDEMDYSEVRYTYNPRRWDGATVIINPKTHAVAGKYSSATLLQQPWKVAFAELLRKNGKVLFGNGAPSTRTLNNLQTPRFVETASYSFLINTHLSSPLGLSNHDYITDEPTRARMARRFLDQGALMVPHVWNDDPKIAPHYLSYMYPTTPEELRAGMVLGKERIVTNRSGRYGWADNSEAEVHIFDGQGKAVPQPQVKTMREKNRVLTEIRMPSDHFAVLIKKLRRR